MKKYLIAKADRKPTPLSIAEHSQKYYRKNKTKISIRNKIRYWEKLRLPPEQWTRYNIPQESQFCPQCRGHKPTCQFILGFCKMCIMCRKPNLPPLDDTQSVYPKK